MSLKTDKAPRESVEIIFKRIEEWVTSGKITREDVQDNWDKKLEQIIAIEELSGLIADFTPEEKELFKKALKRGN